MTREGKEWWEATAEYFQDENPVPTTRRSTGADPGGSTPPS